MKVIVTIYFTMLFFSGCHDFGRDEVISWQISDAQPEDTLLKASVIVFMTDQTVTFQKGSSSVSYPALLTGERLLIKTPAQKRLFRVTRPTDTNMIWQELYSQQPALINLSKISARMSLQDLHSLQTNN